MMRSPLVLLLAGLAIGGLAFGSCQASRASDAEIRLQAALASHAESLAVWGVTRDSLGRSMDSLRADSALLAQRYAAVRRFVPAAKDSITRLLALLPDSITVGITAAVAVVQAAYETCEAIRANCEARAANAEARAAGDSLALARTQFLLTQTEAQWRAEQRRNAPGFLGLRAFWHARRFTIPLTALTTFLLLDRR